MTASNYDYEKFTLEKPESWSEKELSDFLISDYFDAARDLGYQAPEKEILNVFLDSIAKYNRYKYILYFLDTCIISFFKGKKEYRKKILFRPFKYYNIILGAKKYHHVGLVAHGNWDRLFAIKNFMGYIATDDLDQYVVAYIKEKNITYLYRLIKEIANKLRASKPDYIVLWNDITPIERAIILVSKKLGIAILEIQHGAYDSFNFETGKVADYVLVWGGHSKKLCIDRWKRKPEDIYILGYPYVIKKDQETKAPIAIGAWSSTQVLSTLVKNQRNRYVVCYLGQNLEIYSKDFFSLKLETAHNIDAICKKLGLEFIYRPHPGDDRELLKKNLPDIQFTDIKEGIEETFQRADIFISFNSTALIEVAMRSKVALQLLNYPLKSDNLEKLGACSVSIGTIEELDGYLKKIVDANNLDEFRAKFNNDYIETRYNPTERFLEIISEIEEKKE